MKRACVIGWPIEHSRSPLIHGHWLGRYGIEGTYDKLAVPPRQLARFLETLTDAGFAGCNVTIPHKEAVFSAVEVKDAATRRLGAVNTVYVEGGRLTGLNTDTTGFMTHLRVSDRNWRPDRGAAVVLGAGGAAQAVVVSLRQAGVPEVRLVNRTEERARALAAKFESGVVVHSWARREEVLADACLLVNTTSLGMKGGAPLAISLGRLPAQATVYDIVYVPLITPLLREASARGHTIVDGLGMLLHQAVPGFELWFGVRPEVTDELRRVIVADIEAQG